MDQLDRPAQPVEGRALVAHLRADAVLGGHLAHEPCLERQMRERLLTVDVFAGAHGQHRGQGVRVVRRGHGDGVDGFHHLVEQLAVIDVLLGARPGGGALVEPVGVDVAQGDDLHEPAGLLDVAEALAADADAGDAEAVVGAEGPRDRERGAGEQVAEGAGGAELKGAAATDALAHDHNSFGGKDAGAAPALAGTSGIVPTAGAVGNPEVEARQECLCHRGGTFLAGV